jgi:hypothetical protein
MTCETIRTELVAYHDGELPEQDRVQIAAHLSTCPTCSQEVRQLARLDKMLSALEPIPLSPEFASTFWRRLEQEKPEPEESRFVRWWREWLSGWQMMPAAVGAASVLILFGYILSDRLTTTLPTSSAPPVSVEAPAQIAEQPDLFANYRVITELDKFSHFEEITTTESKPEPLPETEPIRPEDLPPPVLENPSFFVQYPILQKMEELQHLEAILALPGEEGQQSRG